MKITVGLEIHVELLTEEKLFCRCPSVFGAAPNSCVCPVCTGQPGALPVLNIHAVEPGVRAGLATGCRINEYSAFDRKNYFYPDLPKAYQITQFFYPLCSDGGFEIDTASGEKRIRIERIHLEEDAGKLIHDGASTLIDFNRCGVPLAEIVTYPDMESAEEAVAFLRRLRARLIYAGVSDCKMQEGSMRCDINVSVDGGERTEIKNLSSFRAVGAAIAYEAERQAALLKAGGSVTRETRRFDEAAGVTLPMRKKEGGEYMYFPEPDIPPLVLSEEYIKRAAEKIPELPDLRARRLEREYGLTKYDAEVLTAERAVADLFEAAAALTEHRALLAGAVTTELFALREGKELRMTAAQLAGAVGLFGGRRINNTGFKKLLKRLWESGGEPETAAEEMQIFVLADEAELERIAEEAIQELPNVLSDIKKGKLSAKKSLMGCIMKKTGGRAEPRLAAEAVERALEKEMEKGKKQ